MSISLGFVDVSVYGIGVSLAAALWVSLLFLTQKDKRLSPVTLGLWVIPLAFLGARLFFCLARFEYVFLEMGIGFALSPWTGGFLLWGMLCGGLLGLFLASRRRGVDFRATADSAAIPTIAAISVLRLFEFFTTEGRGPWLEENSFFARFPFGVVNEYGEWQLAIFLWEAAAALVVLLTLLKHQGSPGDKGLQMILGYSAFQIVLESLRMDSCPRIGFVRVSQVLCAIALLVCVVLRSGRAKGKASAVLRGLITLGCLTIAGVLEWALDKTPIPVGLCYAMMSIALLAAFCVGTFRFTPTSHTSKGVSLS